MKDLLLICGLMFFLTALIILSQFVFVTSTSQLIPLMLMILFLQVCGYFLLIKYHKTIKK